MTDIAASLQRASEDYLKLLDYVSQQPDGAMLDYTGVEISTDVRMDQAGKNKLRRAIERSKRVYSVIPNVGYQLGETSTAKRILTHRLVRIDNQVKRADRDQRIVQERFLESLPPDEQKGVLFLGAVFGAIRDAAEKGKRLYRKERPKLTGTARVIDVPEGVSQ